MYNEKNLPTQQTSSQKDSRISCSHEDRKRTQHHQPPSPQRAQEVSGVITQSIEPVFTGSFSKKDRLLSKYDYKSMKANSRRLVGKCLCIDFRPAPESRNFSRLGITASGKFGSSVERNRFKRLVREAFRTLRHQWPPLEIHLVPRQFAKTAKLSDIANDLTNLLKPK